MADGQLKVLTTLDHARTQWYHFMAIVIAGMGFFTDAYDLFCISLVSKLLGRIYYTDIASDTPGSLPPNVSAAVNGVALCGTLAGQLFFGWLGDKLGRKSVYGFTLVLMVIYPARLRSTCHGISAAAGKAGAIVGAFGFLYAAQDPHKPEAGYKPGIGIRNALFVLAGTNFLGMLMTLLVPESKGMSLEEVSKENVADDEEATA
uniref:H(+)/Pi cotransporter n=1 Tax=Oryza barthii TaxID=65489 RepID=A0A0D3HE59_9ORYZ